VIVALTFLIFLGQSMLHRAAVANELHGAHCA